MSAPGHMQPAGAPLRSALVRAGRWVGVTGTCGGVPTGGYSDTLKSYACFLRQYGLDGTSEGLLVGRARM